MDIEFFPDTKVAKVSGIVTPEEAAMLHDYAVEYKLSGKVPDNDHSRLDDQEFNRTELDNSEDDKDGTRDFWAEKNVYIEEMPKEYQDLRWTITDRVLESFNSYLEQSGDPRTKYEPGSVDLGAIHVYKPGHNLDPHEDCHDYAIVVYLTDPSTYDGGELHYLEPTDILYKPELGTAVIAPSQLVHEVLPVIDGIRCSMTTFFPVELP